MSYDLSKLLVVGISSRALFDLDLENQIFQTEGLQPFIDYQHAHENEALKPGAAFHLIRGLLGLNDLPGGSKIEVILMSRNHPDVCLRVMNSIERHGLEITRTALTGGAPLGPYLGAFSVGLFLSADKDDVQEAANQGFTAGLIYTPPPEVETPLPPIRIAFDGDCVIFSGEAQRIYDEEGDEAFFQYEKMNAEKALPDGPFAKLLRTLAQIQGPDPSKSPIRIALVTDRSVPAHKRALLTLRAWNIRIDEAFFLGGIPKADVLKAFGAHMFFDDKADYCKDAARHVPTSQVLQPVVRMSQLSMELEEVTVSLRKDTQPAGRDRFLLVCKTYLKREHASGAMEMEKWFDEQMSGFSTPGLADFLDELEESIADTPKGNERRAPEGKNSRLAKLKGFLEKLAAKHRRK